MAVKQGRYIPPNAREVAHPEGLGVCYVVDGPKSVAVTAYAGAQSKHAFYEAHRTLEQAQKHIDAFFASLTNWRDIKRKRAANRTRPHTLQVGQVVVNSWGYDQTNIDYYQVIGVSPNFVTLRAIRAKVTETGCTCGNSVPLSGQFAEDATPERHRVTMYEGQPLIHFKFGCGRVSNGEAMYCSWYA